MQKGISPLIATVLLVAFTVALASITIGFYNSFTREQTEGAKEKGAGTVECGFASIELTEVIANSTNLIINVRNIGNHDFTDIDLIVKNTSTSSLMNINTNENVTTGGAKSIIVSNWGAQSVYEITVNTECAGIFSTVRNESGTFNEVF